MEKEYLSIKGIPAVLWGPPSDRIFIAVHGDQSHKEDNVIRVLAEAALGKGYRALSFDLPEHGDRKGEARPCNAQNSVEDLAGVMVHAQSLSSNTSLFGCSIGAYFGMLAFAEAQIRQSMFLSPVVDMKRLIEQMMIWFDVSAERLEREGQIVTPVKTLDWEYYQYVRTHPILWDKPTAILYGALDTLCEYEVVEGFAKEIQADLTVFEDGEHFFHTEKQLAFFHQWLSRVIA